MHILDILCNEAKNSVIQQQLAAVIIKGKKMVSKPCCNSQRNTCRGVAMGSLHAEARAIVNYFGRSLTFDKGKGWCLLWG
jgi:hypothetical protein